MVDEETLKAWSDKASIPDCDLIAMRHAQEAEQKVRETARELLQKFESRTGEQGFIRTRYEEHTHSLIVEVVSWQSANVEAAGK